MGCIHNLSEALSVKSDERIRKQSFGLFELNQLPDDEVLFKTDSDPIIMKERPWKINPKYFKKTYISSLALIKMAIHAKSGGSIEIMGMMTGKIITNSIVVMDVYPLPVEGTETRVNAQAEGYEFMVQYLERSKQVGRDEHIVGWYHSHPGYGCWLSGIDVATQSLNQNFQDPYLAIVIDPVKTAQQGEIEIGAFRTYPDNFEANNERNKLSVENNNRNLPRSKRQDFGVHSDRYYSLDIEIFKSNLDTKILDLLLNKSWISKLIKSNLILDRQNLELFERISSLTEKIKSHEINQFNRFERSFIRIFDSNFEEIIQRKLLITANINSKDKVSNANFSFSYYDDDDSDDEMDEDDEEESDLEEKRDKGRLLDVSDADDAISMESESANKNDVEGDEDEDEEAEVTDASGSIGNSHESNTNPPYLDKRFRKRDYNDNEEGKGSPSIFLPQQNKKYNRSINNQLRISSFSTSGIDSSKNFRLTNLMLDEEYGARLKKLNSSMKKISDLAKATGSADIQDLITLKTQERIFLD